MNGPRNRPPVPMPAFTPSAASGPFLESLYQQYLESPGDVDEDWRRWFESLERGVTAPQAASPQIGPDMATDESGNLARQTIVLRLINAYRSRGHQAASVDPLGLSPRHNIRDLDPAFSELTEEDMEREFNTGSLVGPERMKLRDIISLVENVYTGTVGSEYMYITETTEKRWIQQYLEGNGGPRGLNRSVRRTILERVTAAEGLERYLHRKYVGQKRFSLEGSESLIPLLDELIQRAGAAGVKEIVLGMAHRGRLNVLTNVLGKSPALLFDEFEGRYSAEEVPKDYSGDVKYHQGFSSDIETPGGPVHLALAFNPSHLEIIDPVVEGSVRARQDRRGDTEGRQVLPVAVHGDAAFAGQGVVMETLQMSQARGFTTGGTIHVVINNQIGFTTSNPLDARSTEYCTEVAKIVQAPIFHVNADDPDAVVFITQLAHDYRQEFGKDVVIDLVCYRRHGHNEADEPTVTQPLMYQTIRNHPSTRELYVERLVGDGVISEDEADDMVEEYREALDNGRQVVKNLLPFNRAMLHVDWSPYFGTSWTHPVTTGVPLERLTSLAEKLQQYPEDYEVHRRVEKILADRRKMAAGEIACDWGFAETMAYATLLVDGHPVRLTGQDSVRGTFFHRHAAIHNQKDASLHIPLQHLSEEQARFEVINSLLSEEAVLGFEYGYSTTEPRGLVIWEAQFGDFVNGAQVVIDQFISSGEAKWGRLSGLTLFLPHGFEGQGPEHSSARLERFLQLCAEHNMQVCVPTTPAQMFHMLRRQVLRPYRRPLVVMTPKSLLRHKLSTSAIDELTEGGFLTVIGEIDHIERDAVEHVILCSGKVYFDLLQERRAREQENAAIIRVEQLHPFPRETLSELLESYPNAGTVTWCQEEPKNQGAWYQIQHHIRACMQPGQSLEYAGREASPAPAVGLYKLHLEQQNALVDEALSRVPAQVESQQDRKASNVN